MSTPPEAQYLEGASGAIRDFFAGFYMLLDGETTDAAIAWSNSFTEDAIRAQREEFWGAFPGLVHTPLRVYPSPTLPLQFVVVNRFDFTTKKGARFAHTAAEYTLVQIEDSYLVEKLILYMDPAALSQ